ncbi:hypothetical protein LXL04_000709 [Taraxacum kok-saghyz]
MEVNNKNIVHDLYKALAARDFIRVQCLLAPDIDWWFHGPPNHKYNLMHLLTGSCVLDDNMDYFKPVAIHGFGSMVVAEGYHLHGNRKTCWVHAWTVENGTIITRVREYLNTSLTVFSFRKSDNAYNLVSPCYPKCKNVWQSELADNASVPHLLLVI